MVGAWFPDVDTWKAARTSACLDVMSLCAAAVCTFYGAQEVRRSVCKDPCIKNWNGFNPCMLALMPCACVSCL